MKYQPQHENLSTYSNEEYVTVHTFLSRPTAENLMSIFELFWDNSSARIYRKDDSV